MDQIAKAERAFGYLEAEIEALWDETPGRRQERYLRLWASLDEFKHYMLDNGTSIVNYCARYRKGERISTRYIESTVNQLVSKRMIKKQQMR